MNERIKELAEQCWEARKYGPPWFEYEKFAELIVKDCACVPTDMWGEGELDVHTAVQVHRRILAHFDVA